ncbi:peptide-methionine (S)-S-oxide reductase MsrA [Flavisolibacter nicotianae]|uniref:peptide-methionine (S)-S-oxide reductase MsrA n=1 Tax=Flavisolibacter nicotianae TaxID=2364882 RepID=UPI000EB54B4D|nr:peptide-methionine (S)-S-oxide reductase MsrA [Flavisolibacter nicotianae]
MRIGFLPFLALFFLASCEERKGFVFKAPLPDSTAPAKNEAVATFAEGCFWHTEIVFQSLAGVRDAVSGYAGGSNPAPGYENVSTGSTGHAESVNVYYDPAKISFDRLVAAFFASHDPTQVGHQGPDIGPQYRSIAFYRNDHEKAVIVKAIAAIDASGKYGKKVATEVLPLTNFYPAEAVHQEYIAHHPGNIYVNNVSIPDYLKFRQSFAGPFRDTLIRR